MGYGFLEKGSLEEWLKAGGFWVWSCLVKGAFAWFVLLCRWAIYAEEDGSFITLYRSLDRVAVSGFRGEKDVDGLQKGLTDAAKGLRMQQQDHMLFRCAIIEHTV